MTTPNFDVPPSVMVGDRSDVQAQRILTILRNDAYNPSVTMQFRASRRGVLCGIDEVRALLAKALPETGAEVWVLADGDAIAADEVALRVKAPYSSFGLYEGTICGALASCSGWATAARECVDAAAGIPVAVTSPPSAHPNVVPLIDYAAIVGGCAAVSTALGGRYAGVTPTGYMPHALPLLMGDAVRAMQSYDRHMAQEIPRIGIVDTFRDEAEEAIALARALRERLRGVNLSTPPERGGVTPDLVKEVRARLDQNGFNHVEIFVTHGVTKAKIRQMVEASAPVNGFSVDEAIAGAPPIGFGADIHEIDGKPVARRGRVPGATSSPRLSRVI